VIVDAKVAARAL